MPPQMNLQISDVHVLRAALGAEVDLLLPRVDLGVLLQVGLGDEGLAAVAAQEGSLPRMFQFVRLEVCLLDEGFGAEVAFEGSLVGVGLEVFLQGGGGREGLVAVLTRVIAGAFAGRVVNGAQVVVQVGLLDEELVALWAFVRTISAVTEEMFV